MFQPSKRYPRFLSFEMYNFLYNTPLAREICPRVSPVTPVSYRPQNMLVFPVAWYFVHHSMSVNEAEDGDEKS